MKSRAVFADWLLLTLPALAAGWLMFRLMRSEGQRVAMAEAAAAQQQARLIADDVALSMDEAKDGLAELLKQCAGGDVVEALRKMEQTHPLVRNAFVWQPREHRFLYPATAQGMTADHTDFVRRSEDYFTSRPPWIPVPDEVNRSPAQQPLPPKAAQGKLQWSQNDELQGYGYNTRQEIRNLSKNAYVANQPMQQAVVPQQPRQAPAVLKTGWAASYWDDELHLLGWVSKDNGALYYGVEVEMTALLSRLVAVLPAQAAPGRVVALVDGRGKVVAQRGADEVKPATTVLAAQSLTPNLPHWSASVYATKPPAAASVSYLALALTLSGALTTAIVLGGSLLLLQARRSHRDAQRKTTFVSNVSHELKTPLTTIRMYAEMLSEGRVAAEEKRRSYLDTIARESQRLSRLVGNVLDFSRIEQGRKQYRMERMDLAETVASILDGQEDRMRQAGMEIERTLPDHPCPARTDRDAVEQALLNLLDNAIKYAADGKRIRVLLDAAGPNWRIAVEDAGPGIAQDHRARIFQQFYRADDSLTAKTAGFGLGLSIARRLMRDLGGDLVYEVPAGGGSRFVMILPRPEGDRP